MSHHPAMSWNGQKYLKFSKPFRGFTMRKLKGTVYSALLDILEVSANFKTLGEHPGTDK